MRRSDFIYAAWKEWRGEDLKSYSVGGTVSLSVSDLVDFVLYASRVRDRVSASAFLSGMPKGIRRADEFRRVFEGEWTSNDA